MTLAIEPSRIRPARRPAPQAAVFRESWGLVGLIAAAAVVFGLLPLGRLLLMALAPAGSLALDVALSELTSRAALLALGRTLEVGALSALGALVLGGAFAVLLAVAEIPGRRWLGFVFVFSLMVAPQVVALAYLGLAGSSSPVLGALGLAPAPGTPNPLLGRGGIVLVMALHHAPLVAITVWAGLRQVPRAVVEAAQIEGASPGLVVRAVVLPLIRGHLAAAGLLAFVAGIGNFGIPALMGMPVNYLTLPTLIYRRLTSFGPAVLSEAAALSLLIAILAGLGTLACALLIRGRSAAFELDRPMQPFWRPRRPTLLAGALWALLALKIGLPFLSLLGEALVPALGVKLSWQSLTFEKFAEVLLRQEVTTRAFRNSLLFSGTAALVLGLLSIVFAWGLTRRAGRLRAWVEAAVEVPYALPGVVLAIACILLFLKPLPLIGVSIYGTSLIILFAYLARFLAPALKAPLAAMAQIEPHHEEAALLDGASQWQLIVHVVAPILAPAAVAGALLVFLVAFNELTVSALLWSAGTETLGVVLFSLKEAGLAGEAAAVAVSASAVILAVMLLLDRLAPRLPEGVLPWRL